jgi:hypothetical protein
LCCISTVPAAFDDAARAGNYFELRLIGTQADEARLQQLGAIVDRKVKVARRKAGWSHGLSHRTVSA